MTHGARFCSFAAAIVVFFGPATARAFDTSVHYTVVYAVAVLAGYAPDDAQTIARASQSLDENSSTTAFDGKERLRRDAWDLATLSKLPEDYTWGAPSQVFHSLTSDENRAIASQAHVERLQRYRAESRGDATVGRRNMELVYLGEYLHFVADMFVHPRDPLFGHVDKGHAQDRPNLQRDPLIEAVAAMKGVLDQYGAANGGTGNPQAVRPVPPEAVGRDPGRIDFNPYQEGRFRLLAQTVSDSWARGNPNAWTNLRDTYAETTERARAALAAESVSRFLRDHGGLPYRFFDRTRDAFILDKDGNVIEDRRLRAGGKPMPLGPPASGSFVEIVASQPSFVRERRNAVIRAVTMRDPVKGALLAKTLDVDATVFGVNRLPAIPQTLGGVALDPALTIAGLHGEPRALLIENGHILLETSQARYPIQRIPARSFATILRAVAAGEIPYITIGATPSDRPGYASVIYAPSLRGTREGRVLYEADIRFKALMTDMPLAPRGDLAPAALIGGPRFPFGGGEFARLWITSRNFRLVPGHDGQLVVDRREMRIESERQLNGRTRTDAKLAAYSEHLTAHWDRLTELLPPFAGVEDIALQTALILWARRNGVRFDPALWMLPSRGEITPDYAPIVARLDGVLQTTGGVSVTPEDKRASSGRALLTLLSTAYGSDGWGHSGSTMALVLLALLIGIAVLVVMPTILWVFVWLWGDPPATRSLWKFLISRWTLAAFGIVVLAACTHFIATGDMLGPFDRDFFSFLVGVAAFPIAFLVLLRPWLRSAAGAIRSMTVSVAIVGTAVAGQLGVATAILTVAIAGPVPTSLSNNVLSFQLAAADRFSDALFSTVVSIDSPGVFMMPRSAIEAVQPNYRSEPRWSGSPPASLRRRGKREPTLPFDELHRIPAQGNAPGVAFYSADGSTPF